MTQTQTHRQDCQTTDFVEDAEVEWPEADGNATAIRISAGIRSMNRNPNGLAPDAHDTRRGRADTTTTRTWSESAAGPLFHTASGVFVGERTLERLGSRQPPTRLPASEGVTSTTRMHLRLL